MLKAMTQRQQQQQQQQRFADKRARSIVDPSASLDNRRSTRRQRRQSSPSLAPLFERQSDTAA